VGRRRAADIVGADPARSELAARLESRRAEIAEAVLARVHAVSDPGEVVDSLYAEGLRAAVEAAVSYGLTAIELGEERSPPPPPVLLAQARLAARSGVSLDTVLRRYVAGHALIGDFLVEEAERGDLLEGSALQLLLRSQAALFDRLLVAVSEEYTQAIEASPPTRERRRTKLIERLLAGELLNTSPVAYDFDGFHLGAVAAGEGAAEAFRALASSLDCRLLAVPRDEEVCWAWLGSRRPQGAAAVWRVLSVEWPGELVLAFGEPVEGLSGWRLTHRQAHAALPVALRSGRSPVRYADVALLAALLRDELLTSSLRTLYLDPLARERDGGRALRETLGAYFKSDRNVSSTAAALGVSRQTVVNRLRSVEERIGRRLTSCAAELEAVLRLEGLERSGPDLLTVK